MPSTGVTSLDIAALIPNAIAAIDDPKGGNRMNFAGIGDIAGNLAGDIGKDEAANPVGAQPSTQDDARLVTGNVMLVDRGDTIFASPILKYTVLDTVDLCPGNCGAQQEQTATVPMSRWEATGISGDVPFRVDFVAPPTAPIFIPKKSAP